MVGGRVAAGHLNLGVGSGRLPQGQAHQPVTGRLGGDHRGDVQLHPRPVHVVVHHRLIDHRRPAARPVDPLDPRLGPCVVGHHEHPQGRVALLVGCRLDKHPQGGLRHRVCPGDVETEIRLPLITGAAVLDHHQRRSPEVGRLIGRPIPHICIGRRPVLGTGERRIDGEGLPSRPLRSRLPVVGACPPLIGDTRRQSLAWNPPHRRRGGHRRRIT